LRNEESNIKASPRSSKTIEIITGNTQKLLQLELKLIASAKSKVELLFSSAKAFRMQQKVGIIHSMRDTLIKNGVHFRILIPKTDEYNEEMENINGIDVRYFNYNSNLRNKILIVDREQSLVMTIKEEEYQLNVFETGEERAEQQHQQTIGSSTYSNNKSTVLSYAVMFEALWNETKVSDPLRESHRKLEVANEQLESRYKTQKDLLRIAAHELRTPMHTILGFAEMLHMEPERGKEYATPILRNAELLGRLSQDILDIEKIESHTLKLNKEKFNLTKTILSVVQDINSSLMRIDQRRKINVHGVADDNDDVVIEADKTRIIQVISNILNNAIKFTKNDDEITISIEMKEKEVMISVKDTGPGIDSNTLPKLLSRCALTPSSKAEGSGLGLFISKSIVESHGGKIWAENNADGRGSTFSFSLPINDVNRDRLKY